MNKQEKREQIKTLNTYLKGYKELLEEQKTHIKNIENSIKELEQKKIELKQELNKTEEGWIPKYNEKFWFYDKDVENIKCSCWTDDDYDIVRLKNKVIFKTEEEAQRYADYQKAKEEYSYEFSREKWKNLNNAKYYIEYCYSYKELIVITKYTNNKAINEMNFKLKEQAQEFIDKYKNEILEYEFGIKE